MKIRRKASRCLNCNSTLDNIYNFCPNCGQENNDNNVSFITLFMDYLSNYFAYDSKFIRTLGPFFLKPGFLTNRFNEGKRVSYAHPLRLYFLTSLAFFFITGIIVNRMDTNADVDLSELSSEIKTISEFSSAKFDKLDSTLPDSIKTKVVNLLKKNKKLDVDGLSIALKGLMTKEDSMTFRSLLLEDSLNWQTVKERLLKDSTTSRADESFVLNQVDWKLVDSLRYEKQYSEKQLLEMMNIDLEKVNTGQKILVIQILRVYRSGDGAFKNYVWKNIPIMMLAFIPIFALSLLLMYRRRKILYIRHIVHALHLHSFAYIALILVVMLKHFADDHDWASTINTLIVLATFLYFYVSFLRVYGQSWKKTFAKFIFSTFFYGLFISLFLIAEAFILFFLF